jgi:hypothetical protein
MGRRLGTGGHHGGESAERKEDAGRPAGAGHRASVRRRLLTHVPRRAQN